jgi:hypothetical protein
LKNIPWRRLKRSMYYFPFRSSFIILPSFKNIIR